MDSFWTISGFLGHHNDIMIMVTFTPSTHQKMPFFHDISIFLSQPTCGKLRKIEKSPKKRIVWSVEAVKVNISEIDTFHDRR